MLFHSEIRLALWFLSKRNFVCSSGDFYSSLRHGLRFSAGARKLIWRGFLRIMKCGTSSTKPHSWTSAPNLSLLVLTTFAPPSATVLCVNSDAGARIIELRLE